TRSRSASAATRRGITVSSISSSAVNQITLPCGAVPSLHGHTLPFVHLAIMSALVRPLPLSGRPPTSPSFPSAKRPGQDQRTARTENFEALVVSSSGLSSGLGSDLGWAARVSGNLATLPGLSGFILSRLYSATRALNSSSDTAYVI